MTFYKMNEKIINFFLAGDIFMPEMHLKKLDFTYRGPFTKYNERFKNLKKQEIQDRYTEIN